MGKRIMILCISIVLSVSMSFSVFAGQWKQDTKGWWYQNDNGSYQQNGWYQCPDGKYYYFGSDGYLLVNTTTPDGFTVDSNGARVQDLPAHTSQGTSQQAAGTGQSNQTQAAQSQDTTETYVLNINSKKFHKPGCSAVRKMKDKNNKTCSGTRDSIISQGYSPCKICNP